MNHLLQKRKEKEGSIFRRQVHNEGGTGIGCEEPVGVQGVLEGCFVVL